MSFRALITSAILFLGFMCIRVEALDMNVRTHEAEKKVFANLWGNIEFGDDQKFRQLVTPYLRKGYILFKVNIFSGGGNVHAAKGIGEQIKALQTRTVAPTRFARIVNNQPVENNYPSCWFTEDYDIPKPVEGQPWCTCTSACFLIWASGITREGNHVGVHRITFVNEGASKFGQMSGPEARQMYQREQADFQEYIRKLDVPSAIAERLWATDSRNMHFLTKSELELMQSTPYLEEQTLARCGPSKTVHMSRSNNWTSTQDARHVDCYRNLLVEFMREGTKAYLQEVR
jgi:hypothetical protein